MSLGAWAFRELVWKQSLLFEVTGIWSSTNLESNTVPSSIDALKWKRTKSVLTTERLQSLGVLMTLVWTWSALLKMSSRTRSNTNVVSGGTVPPKTPQKEYIFQWSQMLVVHNFLNGGLRSSGLCEGAVRVKN